MNELALFAGAGGGILGGQLLGWETVCAVEVDAFCARRLMQRQNEGHLSPFPIWADGVAFRVDRLRAIGNGQVPQCAAEAWRRLLARV